MPSRIIPLIKYQFGVSDISHLFNVGGGQYLVEVEECEGYGV